MGITRSKIGLIIVGEFCLNYIAIEQRFDSPWLVCVLWYNLFTMGLNNRDMPIIQWMGVHVHVVDMAF